MKNNKEVFRKKTVLNRSFRLIDLWILRVFALQLLRRILRPLVFFNTCKWFMLAFMRPEKLPYMPLYAMIEPTSRCNISCAMCRRSLFKFNRAKMDMPLHEFKKIIDELSECFIFVVLWNYGEPLLHKDLEEMIAYCSKKGLITILSTNGLLLEYERSKKLISAGLKYIIVSVDATDKWVYNKYRSGSDFNKVEHNVKNVCKLKKQMNSVFPIVELQCIVMKYNEPQIRDFSRMAKLWGADRSSLKKFNISLSYKYPDNFLPKNSRFISEAFQNDRNIHKLFCVTPWRSLVINSDGNVVPCCSDYFSDRKMGNAFSSNIKDLWNSQKYVKFRKAIKHNIDAIEICADCPHPGAQEGHFV